MTRRFRLGLVVAAAILAADQATKAGMMALLGVAGAGAAGRRIVVNAILDLVAVWNRGMSFGLFGAAGASWAFVALALAISAGLVWWLRRVERAWTALAIGLILGGALGNVIDRVRFGAVFDFLYFHLGDWYWPAFNLADSAITVGVGLLLLDSLFETRESHRRSAKVR